MGLQQVPIAPVHNNSGQPMPELVLVGAGPAGLAAALAASHRGVDDILVLESRSGSQRRNNVLLLDASILSALQQLQVDVSGFTPATAFTFIDGDAGVRFRFPLGRSIQQCVKPRAASLFSMFPRRSPAADVLISELEQVLLRAIASRPGIRIVPNVAITAISPSATGRRIEYSNAGIGSVVETPLLAVCDGARSRTLDLLGIRRRGNPRQEVAMVANFRQPGRGQIKFQCSEPLQEVLALCSDSGSTVTIRMPLDTHPAAHSDADACRDYMLRHAANLGIGGEFISPPVVVEISHDRAERCLLGKDVFVLGDAARTATPRLGLGANWAIRDALRFASLLPAIRSSRPSARALARFRFRLRTRLATEVLLLQGWLLKRSDRRSSMSMPAHWRFRQKSLLMRFMWRSGKGEVQAGQNHAQPVGG